MKPADIETEVFFFPSAQVAETEGTFTNTQRMLQWHYKAADPPGDCRSDIWFTYQLGKRLKGLYAGQHGARATRDSSTSSSTTSTTTPTRRRAGEPDAAQAPARRSTGSTRTIPARHVATFADCKDDGSTTCASWIYCGVFPAPDRNLAAAAAARSARRAAAPT